LNKAKITNNATRKRQIIIASVIQNAFMPKAGLHINTMQFIRLNVINISVQILPPKLILDSKKYNKLGMINVTNNNVKALMPAPLTNMLSPHVSPKAKPTTMTSNALITKNRIFFFMILSSYLGNSGGNKEANSENVSAFAQAGVPCFHKRVSFVI